MLGVTSVGIHPGYSPGFSLCCAARFSPDRFGPCPLRCLMKCPDFDAVTAAISPDSTWFVRSRPQSFGMRPWLEMFRWMNRQWKPKWSNRFGAGGVHPRIASRSCRGLSLGDRPKKLRATEGSSWRSGRVSDPRPSLAPWLLIVARVTQPRWPAQIVWSVCSWGLQIPKQSPWP
jgi:hypothetical protein